MRAGYYCTECKQFVPAEDVYIFFSDDDYPCLSHMGVCNGVVVWDACRHRNHRPTGRKR